MPRTFVPVFVDRFQSSTYRLERYTETADGRLLAHFGDGASRPSVFPNVAALLEAGRRDWHERVREVRS